MTDPGPILGDTSSQDAAVPSLDGFQFLINRFLFDDFGCIIVFNVFRLNKFSFGETCLLNGSRQILLCQFLL